MPKWKQKWKIDLVLSSETVTKFQSPVRGELKKKNHKWNLKETESKTVSAILNIISIYRDNVS